MNMKNECPHCGETYSALKNHIRLASGGGHGSSGSYPEEDETNERTENSDQKELNITTEELETRLKQASDNAYKAGREDERREREQSPPQENSPVAVSKEQPEAVTTVPAEEEQSEHTTSNWLTAAGGIAALALIGKELDDTRSQHRRKRL